LDFLFAMKVAVLIIVSLAISLIAGEGMLRLFLDEVDYIRPRQIKHPILNYAIAPGSGGHDRWGFRNKQVPDHAQIVTVGDSMTYGTSTPARQNYPSQLARMLGKSVYNVSKGGYGPPHYAYLVNKHALSLSPDVILIGFYFGNDLDDTYRYVTGTKYDQDGLDQMHAAKFMPGLRDWLTRNSMVYQTVKLNSGVLVETLAYYEAAKTKTSASHVYSDGIRRTVFVSTREYYATLDQSVEKNRTSLAVAIDILSRLFDSCAKSHTRCMLLLFPTKESVYWPYAEKVLSGSARADVQALVRMEQVVREILVGTLNSRGVETIDPLDDMRDAAGREPLYFTGYDNHPNANGHRVIATVVAEQLKATQ
jgi:hypothetical protein